MSAYQPHEMPPGAAPSALGRGFAGAIGIHLLGVENGVSRGELPFVERLLNSGGAVHGGAIFTLVDTVMGAAVHATLEPGWMCATVDIQISYLRAVISGPIMCRAELLKRGQRLAHLQARVTVDGVLVAAASGNFAIFQPSHRPPRADPTAST